MRMSQRSIEAAAYILIDISVKPGNKNQTFGDFAVDHVSRISQDTF